MGMENGDVEYAGMALRVTRCSVVEVEGEMVVLSGTLLGQFRGMRLTCLILSRRLCIMKSSILILTSTSIMVSY